MYVYIKLKEKMTVLVTLGVVLYADRLEPMACHYSFSSCFGYIPFGIRGIVLMV